MDGTITSANASKLNDGACCLLVANQKGLSANNLTKQFEILSYSDAEMDPIDFNKSPSLAIQYALKKAQISLEDVDFFEINEVIDNFRHFQ